MVKETVLDHSHDVSKEIKASYPENRRLPADIKAEAANMLSLGVNVERLRRHLTTLCGKQLTRKDLHNIRTSSKRSAVNEEDNILEELETILDCDPACSIKVHTDTNNELEAIFIQTSAMKKMTARYSDVIEIDTTYNINDRRMPLVSAVIDDGNRNGQVIAQCIIRTESEENIKFFLDCLLSEVPEVQKKLRCVVVDKDCTLLGAINKRLPNVKTILCAFHVAKTFRKETAAMETSSEEREKVRKELQAMMYATSAEQYNDSLKKLKEVCKTKFFAYFMKNWDSIKSTWVRCLVDVTGHLGNRTTNRIEAYHSALKRFMPGKQSVSEMINGLRLYNEGVCSAIQHKELRAHLTKKITNEDFDEAVKQFREIMTEASAADVQRTLATACKLRKGATFAQTSDGYSVQSVPSAKAWNVSAECSTCDCPTFTTIMLPCKHVFMARLHCSMCLFDKALINDRWLRSVKCGFDVSGSVTLTQKSKKKAKRLTKSAKFTQMQTLCKEIAGVCSGHSMENYTRVRSTERNVQPVVIRQKHPCCAAR